MLNLIRFNNTIVFLNIRSWFCVEYQYV